MRYARGESSHHPAMGIRRLAFFGFLALAWASATSAAPDPVILYRGLVLIDGTGGPARPGWRS